MERYLPVAAALAFLAMIAAAQAQIPFTPPEIIIFTDRQAYKQGENVAILGIVVDSNFRPVPRVTISVIVINPENAIVLDIETTTNQSGVFTASYRIGRDSPEGEYLITAEDLEGEFTPGTRNFIVCNICPTEAGIVIVTTTLPGPTVTTTATLTTTAVTVRTTTATIQATDTTGNTPPSSLLDIIFVILIIALFITLIIAIRKYA